MKLSKNFNSQEFDSSDKIGSGILMNQHFVDKLQELRDLYGKPIIIISGYRTSALNRRVNGAVNSSHILGLAADIFCRNSKDRFDLITLALQVGFTRIGLNKSTIHLDLDTSKPQSVLWHYYK